MNQMMLGLDPLPKKTRKEVFLDEMNRVVPWVALVDLIRPHARGAHQALGGRPLAPGEVEPLAQGAIAHAATISGADYLDAVGRIHAFGREMAAFFDPDDGPGHDILLTATLAEPPARIGRFAHTDPDFVHFRTGPGMIFDHSPFCAAFNASGQPAASLPLGMTGDGLPVGIHLAARSGADEDLVALCAQIEAAAPWSGRRPPPPFGP
jgi:amidase/6-aminohexanoate-cyclic-dimer hydrolase